MWISFVDPFCYLFFCVCLLYCLVCSFMPWDHLLGKGRPLGSLVRDVFLCFLSFSRVEWYSVVSIPDLCLLPYCT